MRPVWLCPLRATRDWPSYPLAPGATYVNVGFWGTVPIEPGAADGDQNRAVEAEVTALGGHKSLYSDAYYDRETFDRLYGVANQTAGCEADRPGQPAHEPLREGGESSMTSTLNRPDAAITIGEAISRLMPAGVPFRFTAYDGSTAGPADSPIHLHLRNERGLSYLLTAPGDLGMARAYVSGDLTLEGVHPGDPYEAMLLLQRESGFKMPSAGRGVPDRPRARAGAT